MSTATAPPPLSLSSHHPTASSSLSLPATKNHLSLRQNPAPLPLLSLSHSSFPDLRRRDSTVTPQRPHNPPFLLHGIAKFFEGLTSFLSSFNPILKDRGGRGRSRKQNKTLSHIFCPPAMAAEDNNKNPNKGWDSHGLEANTIVQLNRLSGFKNYKVSNVNFVNPRTRSVVNYADESFGDLVALNPGKVYTKHDFMDRLELLTSTGYFKKIDLEAKTNPDGTVDINIPFRENVYPSKTLCQCISVGLAPELKPVEMDPNMTQKEQVAFLKSVNEQYRERHNKGRGCIFPQELLNEISWTMSKRTSMSASFLINIWKQMQKWYRDNGFDGAHVIRHSNPEMNPGGDITFEVVEGDITSLGIKFRDKLGNVCEGNTDIRVIKRALPNEVAVGKVFNSRAFQKAQQNILSLGLFSQVNVIPVQNEKNGTLSLEFELQEHQQKWAEVKTDWNIIPGRNSRPTLASIQPGATISFGHRNIKGLNRSFEGAITLSNLFEPEDDIGYNFEYTHPYLDGVENPKNRTFKAACFNTRKVSPVFRGGHGVDHTPIWVDRSGIKATITEDYTSQSRFSYGLVMEDIKTLDEEGNIVGKCHVPSIDGQVRANGPPTTLSGNGVDRMAFLQANITRDNTKIVNGATVGDRDVLQVDQGLGIGTKFAFFNRHKISATRFIPLMKVDEGKGKAPPPVLVLHGLYAGCVGDLPNHEALTIGGPYSVRGYSNGEIAASRNKLEVAAEIRVPVKNTYAYAFAEHGTDLGSSVGVQGNPTESFMRMGSGSSYGAGIKLGQVRAEYAVDHNTRNGRFFFHFGDRF